MELLSFLRCKGKRNVIALADIASFQHPDLTEQLSFFKLVELVEPTTKSFARYLFVLLTFYIFQSTQLPRIFLWV
jgi:hypothetical protein